jgi:hypothetical protein
MRRASKHTQYQLDIFFKKNEEVISPRSDFKLNDIFNVFSSL